MEEKIKLEFTKDELGVIFDCMCGTYSCPKEYVDLINYIAKFITGNGVYCPSSLNFVEGYGGKNL